MTDLGFGSICIIYKRLRPSQWRRFICFVMFLTPLPVLMSCEMAQNKIQASRAGGEVTSISKITPIAAKPNEVVSLTGSNFYEAKNLKVSLELANGERATVPLAITDTKTASFTMPDGIGLGVKDVTLTQGSSQVEVARFNLIVDQADNQLPIWIGDASEICNTRDYIDRNGETKTGTKDCATRVTPPACTQNGSIGCVTTETYKAADLTNLSASNIKSGVTIAGVTGTVTQSPGDCWANGQQWCVANGSYFAGTMCLGGDSNCFLDDFGGLKAINYSSILTNASNIRSGVTISDVTGTLGDCSANAVTGCVTTSTYKSADLTNLSAGNIKSGVTIAGTAGQYPSSSFPLTGSSGSDLTTATFDAQIKSSGTFQYFGSDGARYTGTGDTDITAANIASGVDIFGATGSLTGAVAPDPWNVRVGVTVNGVTGKLKVNCRNRVSTSSPTLYNYDGAIGSIGQGSQTGGSVRDIWDTIDDYNNAQVGVPGGVVASWSSSTDCYGIESGAGDDNVWKDVTTTNGTTASTCAATSGNCTMQDKITGLWWSKLQASGAWDTAWNTCVATLNNTTYSGNSVAGYNGQTGWRLPTQKELLEAYTHGIRSAASTNWIFEGMMNYWFWSGSSVSTGSYYGWNVNLATGVADYYGYGDYKDSGFAVVCVR